VLGKGGALAKLAPVFRLGAGAVLGPGRQWWSWIHVDDAAGLFVHALETESLRGPINAAAGAVPQRDFALALGRALRRPVLFRTPAPILRLALGEMASSLLESQRAEASKARESGYLFRYPDLDAALNAALSA
jgi:NAD dependent epimerase/dehydratase family enzyme